LGILLREAGQAGNGKGFFNAFWGYKSGGSFIAFGTDIDGYRQVCKIRLEISRWNRLSADNKFNRKPFE